MYTPAQIQGYKKLITFINANFKEEINSIKVEQICHYSYRNINRIFLSINNEPIGKYLKRIRIEKSAEYLLYTQSKISDIAFEFGFENASAYNKAFKKRFNCSPKEYRKNWNVQQYQGSFSTPLDFSLEFVPDFDMLYLEYRGDYKDYVAITKHWDEFIQHCEEESLISEETKFFAQILDDDDISKSNHTRYQACITLPKRTEYLPKGFHQRKKHIRQKYVKVVCKNGFKNTEEIYSKIIQCWDRDVQLEFKDQPIIEFYDEDFDTEIVEIYIPVE